MGVEDVEGAAGVHPTAQHRPCPVLQGAERGTEAASGAGEGSPNPIPLPKNKGGPKGLHSSQVKGSESSNQPPPKQGPPRSAPEPILRVLQTNPPQARHLEVSRALQSEALRILQTGATRVPKPPKVGDPQGSSNPHQGSPTSPKRKALRAPNTPKSGPEGPPKPLPGGSQGSLNP